jgi:hypothetical protein
MKITIEFESSKPNVVVDKLRYFLDWESHRFTYDVKFLDVKLEKK